MTEEELREATRTLEVFGYSPEDARRMLLESLDDEPKE